MNSIYNYTVKNGFTGLNINPQGVAVVSMATLDVHVKLEV